MEDSYKLVLVESNASHGTGFFPFVEKKREEILHPAFSVNVAVERSCVFQVHPMQKGVY